MDEAWRLGHPGGEKGEDYLSDIEATLTRRGSLVAFTVKNLQATDNEQQLASVSATGTLDASNGELANVKLTVDSIDF